jgi:hypothetical protein
VLIVFISTLPPTTPSSVHRMRKPTPRVTRSTRTPRRAPNHSNRTATAQAVAEVSESASIAPASQVEVGGSCGGLASITHSESHSSTKAGKASAIPAAVRRP